jgi:hypothetical protein
MILQLANLAMELLSKIEKKQRHKCHLLAVRGALEESFGFSCRRNPGFGLIGFTKATAPG